MRHGKCESDTAALCKSNGKDILNPFSGTVWQGNGMGAAWALHAMCELALVTYTKALFCHHLFYVFSLTPLTSLQHFLIYALSFSA
jgi:hypothetical protein